MERLFGLLQSDARRPISFGEWDKAFVDVDVERRGVVSRKQFCQAGGDMLAFDLFPRTYRYKLSRGEWQRIFLCCDEDKDGMMLPVDFQMSMVEFSRFPPLWERPPEARDKQNSTSLGRAIRKQDARRIFEPPKHMERSPGPSRGALSWRASMVQDAWQEAQEVGSQAFPGLPVMLQPEAGRPAGFRSSASSPRFASPPRPTRGFGVGTEAPLGSAYSQPSLHSTRGSSSTSSLSKTIKVDALMSKMETPIRRSSGSASSGALPSPVSLSSPRAASSARWPLRSYAAPENVGIARSARSSVEPQASQRRCAKPAPSCPKLLTQARPPGQALMDEAENTEQEQHETVSLRGMRLSISARLEFERGTTNFLGADPESIPRLARVLVSLGRPEVEFSGSSSSGGFMIQERSRVVKELLVKRSREFDPETNVSAWAISHRDSDRPSEDSTEPPYVVGDYLEVRIAGSTLLSAPVALQLQHGGDASVTQEALLDLLRCAHEVLMEPSGDASGERRQTMRRLSRRLSQIPWAHLDEQTWEMAKEKARESDYIKEREANIQIKLKDAQTELKQHRLAASDVQALRSAVRKTETAMGKCRQELVRKEEQLKEMASLLGAVEKYRAAPSKGQEAIEAWKEAQDKKIWSGRSEEIAAAVNEMKKEVAQRDDQLNQRCNELAEKSEELARKGKELSHKDAELIKLREAIEGLHAHFDSHHHDKIKTRESQGECRVADLRLKFGEIVNYLQDEQHARIKTKQGEAAPMHYF